MFTPSVWEGESVAFCAPTTLAGKGAASPSAVLALRCCVCPFSTQTVATTATLPGTAVAAGSVAGSTERYVCTPDNESDTRIPYEAFFCYLGSQSAAQAREGLDWIESSEAMSDLSHGQAYRSYSYPLRCQRSGSHAGSGRPLTHGVCPSLFAMFCGG